MTTFTPSARLSVWTILKWTIAIMIAIARLRKPLS